MFSGFAMKTKLTFTFKIAHAQKVGKPVRLTGVGPLGAQLVMLTLIQMANITMIIPTLCQHINANKKYYHTGPTIVSTY